jgi:hypothetical protein
MLLEISRLLCLEWGMIPLSDKSPIFVLAKDGKEYAIGIAVAKPDSFMLNFEPFGDSIMPNFLAVLVIGKANDNFIVIKSKGHEAAIRSGSLNAKEIVEDIIYKNRIEYE